MLILLRVVLHLHASLLVVSLGTLGKIAMWLEFEAKRLCKVALAIKLVTRSLVQVNHIYLSSHSLYICCIIIKFTLVLYCSWIYKYLHFTLSLFKYSFAYIKLSYTNSSLRKQFLHFTMYHIDLEKKNIFTQYFC